MLANNDKRSSASGFKPIQILEIEIGQPLPDVPSSHTTTGLRYERALALIRLHTQPLGVVNLRLPPGGITAGEWAAEIWRALSRQIIAHAQRDGLPQPHGLDAAGLISTGRTACLRAREAFLASAPFVSVIVTTRDRPESLAICLRSLLELDYPSYEIIIVDNASSTPATADVVRRVAGAAVPVRYLRADPAGNARARNRALGEVTAPFVAWTDDDVVVDRHWLSALIQGFSAADNVACVTGLVFPRELETPSQVWFEQYGGLGKGCTGRVYDLAAHRLRSPLYPYSAGRFGAGANMAFRTELLRELNGFDPALGPGTDARGGEDLAVYFEVIVRGYALVYEPASIVYHQHRREYKALRTQMYTYGIGLTAFLAKSLLRHPELIVDFTTRIPLGLAYAFSTQSAKNRMKRSDYPRELTTVERLGMLWGPLAYVRSRWKTRGQGGHVIRPGDAWPPAHGR